MDALGNIQPIVIRIPKSSAQSVLPTASQATSLPVIGRGDSSIDFSGQTAEDARMEHLRQAARNAPQPLGSQAFTMFKDATGQVITRFRDTNSGKVVYIPEPNLLRMANSTSGSQSVMNIIA